MSFDFLLNFVSEDQIASALSFLSLLMLVGAGVASWVPARSRRRGGIGEPASWEDCRELGAEFELELLQPADEEPPTLVGQREGLTLTVLPRWKLGNGADHEGAMHRILVARLVVAPLLSRQLSLRAGPHVRLGGENSSADLNPLFAGIQGHDREVLCVDNRHSGLLRAAILHAFRANPRSFLRDGILHLEPDGVVEDVDPHAFFERVEEIARELTRAAAHAKERSRNVQAGAGGSAGG